MPPLSDSELATRLLTAALLGAILGFEREMRHKSAGLRTNILIALGSALFTSMSYELAGPGGDPGRVAAQIVTGIGFLGAGAILRTDSGVQGLTTAATVWVNAAVGMAAGGGEYRLAFIATAITVGALFLLAPVERIIDRRFGPTRRPPAGASSASPLPDSAPPSGPSASPER